MSNKAKSSRLQSVNKLIQDESSIVSERPYKDKLQSSGNSRTKSNEKLAAEAIVEKDVSSAELTNNNSLDAPVFLTQSQSTPVDNLNLNQTAQNLISADISEVIIDKPLNELVQPSSESTPADTSIQSDFKNTESNSNPVSDNSDISDCSDDSERCSTQPKCDQDDEESCSVATLTGVAVTLDESASLQNASTSLVAGDNDDNDISVSQLPSDFSSRLGELEAGVPIESALSGYDGTAGKNVFTIPSASLVASMTLTNASGNIFSGEDSGLKTLAEDSIFLFSDESNSDIVLGKTTSDVIVFAVYLEQTSMPVQGGALWTVLYEPLYHNDPTNHDDKLSLDGLVHVKLETLGADLLDTATPGQHLFFMVGDTDAGYVVTGRDPANQSEGINPNKGDRVNVSNAGGDGSIGINNQMIDPPAKPGSSENNSGEGAVFTFVTDPDSAFTGENLSQTEADVEANINFGGLNNVESATFTISQTQPVKAATVKISAYATSLETGVNFIDGLLDDDISVDVIGVTVMDMLGNVLAKSDGSVVSSLIQINFADGSATIKGIKADYQIEYETAGTHNRVLIENPGSTDKDFNSAFDIGGFSYEKPCIEILNVGEFIVFEDSGPSTGFNPVAYMDDDSLPGGNTGGISDATPDIQNTSGILSHEFGADGAGSIAWLFSGAPAGYEYVAQDDDLLIRQGETTVLTLTLNPATGAYVVI